MRWTPTDKVEVITETLFRSSSVNTPWLKRINPWTCTDLPIKSVIGQLCRLSISTDYRENKNNARVPTDKIKVVHLLILTKKNKPMNTYLPIMSKTLPKHCLVHLLILTKKNRPMSTYLPIMSKTLPKHCFFLKCWLKRINPWTPTDKNRESLP